MTDTESPEVIARVEENWAALEIGGETQTIRADSEEEVRHEVLRRTIQIAADTNRDVSLIATDRDGEWRLVVSPEGEISETGTPSRVNGAHQGGDASTVTDAGPTDSSGDPSGTDLSESSVARGDIGENDVEHDEDQALWISAPPAGEDPPAGEESSAPTAPVVTAGTEPDRVGYAFSGTIDEPTASESAAGDGRESAIDEDTVRREAIFPPEAPLTVDPPAPVAEDTILRDDTDAASSPEPAAEPAADAAPEPEHASVSGPAPVSEPASVTDSAASPAASPGASAAALPTLADFQASQPPPVAGPANQGWRGAIRRGTGGLISPKPGPVEQRHREAIASVTRSLSGPRTICVINPKGGAHKTTATMLIAATFGLYRGGYTLAWDNNETRGTLGWRAHKSGHANTAVNLLNDLDRFTDLRSARVGDLDNYVRSQAEAQFDVLASDEDAAASSMIDDDAFRRLHETLQRFYRIIVVDTGNNMRASNWEAAIAAADQLVIVSAIREDTAGGAAWMVEGLAKKGQEAKLRDAVTILSAPDKNVDASLRTRLVDHFGSLTRDVIEVPYDPALVSGGGISIAALSPATREAWLMATATVANGL